MFTVNSNKSLYEVVKLLSKITQICDNKFFKFFQNRLRWQHPLEVHKLCFETKMTMLGVSHFTRISGHFFANYINSCHKTEVLTVTLKGPTCQNLNWIKSYDINYKLSCFLLYSIL